MRELDLTFIRSQFPAFAEPTLQGFAHFENAGGSYASGQTIEHLCRFYRATKVQPYYDFPPARRAGEAMDSARERLAAWLNVASDEIHLGPSSTQNNYVLAQALRGHLRPGDEFIVTAQDHEANVGAWRRLEADGIAIREWRVDPGTGELDPAGLDALLNERTRAVAFTHCSNLIGSVHPVKAWVERIHAADAIAIVDGVAHAPHGLPDLNELGVDVYTFSAYKVYGPHLGVMYIRRELNQTLPNQGHFFKADQPTARFTPAGPDHAQVAALNGVIDYLELVHDHHFDEADARLADKGRRVRALFHTAERGLLQPLLDFVSAHPRTRLLGRADTTDRAPTVAFAIEGQRPAELGSKLGAEDIGIGVGHFYAYRLVEALGLDTSAGVARASYVHYTSEQDIARLLEALDRHL